MLGSFRSIASSAVPVNEVLRVTSIHASFGSINRTDVTDITIRPVDDGYLLTANVNYRPSVAFWFILILTLFTWVFWLIPITFYMLQKETVKRGIEEGFRNVKNELGRTPTTQPSGTQANTSIADLERLAGLLEKGLLTQEEFNSQKAQLLGIETPVVVVHEASLVPENPVTQSDPATTAPPSQWFYKLMGEEIGPITSAALKSLATAGTIDRDTFVRRGTSKWVLAVSVKGLFSPAPGDS
jgi:hypothetical protein